MECDICDENGLLKLVPHQIHTTVKTAMCHILRFAGYSFSSNHTQKSNIADYYKLTGNYSVVAKLEASQTTYECHGQLRVFLANFEHPFIPFVYCTV